jgi:prepilin-type N-terminal cleavage/methylation domain-containing protein
VKEPIFQGLQENPRAPEFPERIRWSGAINHVERAVDTGKLETIASRSLDRGCGMNMRTSVSAKAISGFTLLELLVVIAIIAVLVAMLLPALSRAQESSKRAVCASNLRQCGYALSIYPDEYKRYPHQREPVTGNPYGDGTTVWTLLGWYVAHEWEQVVRVGGVPQYSVVSSNMPGMRLRVFSCPDLGDPIPNWQHQNSPNGGDGWAFQMNYNFVGGAARWSMADLAFSPIRPTDPPTWLLMADTIREYPVGQSPRRFSTLAHKERDGQPAGANHLFNDCHVQWVRWNGGQGMRANAYWAGNEYWYWRRTIKAP